jgi:hypothetical protein
VTLVRLVAILAKQVAIPARPAVTLAKLVAILVRPAVTSDKLAAIPGKLAVTSDRPVAIPVRLDNPVKPDKLEPVLGLARPCPGNSSPVMNGEK